jgi:indole-3-acetate monooxygenase
VTATGTAGRALPVDGGYRVSGRWPFGSGIHGATALTGLCSIEPPDRNGPVPTIMCCAPASAARVIDTWQVSGLRGTGSCDWVLEDAFVPAAQTFGFPAQRATQPGAVYRMPAISSFTWSVAVVPLAVARAALDAFLGIACDRVRVGTSQPLREREVIQSEVGRADAMLRAGRALLIEAMQALVAAVERGEEDLLGVRAGRRQAAAHAAETAQRVATMLETMAGTAAILEAGRLARWLRDLRASIQHVAMSPNNFILPAACALASTPAQPVFESPHAAGPRGCCRGSGCCRN